jgi:hypothetical protein
MQAFIMLRYALVDVRGESLSWKIVRDKVPALHTIVYFKFGNRNLYQFTRSTKIFALPCSRSAL